MKQGLLDAKITEYARLHPHKIAIKREERSISYRELDKRSNRVANFMHGRIKEIPHVIIILDRSPELIESIIGLLKCGLVFAPLNPLFPGNRVKKMIEETRAEWVITKAKYYEKFKDVINNNTTSHLKTLLIDGDSQGGDSHNDMFYLDSDIESEGLAFERVFNKNCYIYFTSGSTGTPKGVLGRRRSLAHFIQWEIKEFGVNEDFNVSQLTPPSFDPFLRDIFVPLMAGGTSCIPSDNTLTNIKELTRWIDENSITLIHSVPSLFKQLVLGIKDSNCFHSLKYILLAGELLRGRDISRFIDIFKARIQLINVYGPTETTLAKLFYPITPGDVNRAIIPVGKPIDGAQVLILDSKKQKRSRGKKGEVYIRTPFMSSGYYNDPVLTGKVFIKNPYGKHPQDILYKTGDLGRVLPDGNIEISGRVDYQVKIRGIRVELGEIENQLLRHEDVQEAVVTAKEDDSGDKCLCAYVVPVPGKAPNAPVLRKFLSGDLPDYMIPNFFVLLEKIPLTANGKIDRSALPGTEIEVEGEYAAPRDQQEEKLVDIWSEVLALGKEKIGIDSNFFELGGHSLKAIILISKMHREFNVKISLAEVFRTPTIRALSEQVKKSKQSKHVFIEPVEKKEYYELSSAQKRFYILQQMNPENTSFNILRIVTLEGKSDREKLMEIPGKLIKRHESLRTSFEMMEGKPIQKIHTNIDPEVDYHDLSGSGQVFSPDDSIKRFLRPFDLSQAPLMRIGLIQIEKEKHLLMVDIHHITADGLSVGILVNEFLALYGGRELPGLRIQYKDFSEWYNSRKTQETMKKQEDYWLRIFNRDIPVPELPTDYARPAEIQDFEGDVVRFRLVGEETKALKDLAKEENTSLYIVILAVCNIWLWRICVREFIIVGTGAAGRSNPDLGQLVGSFQNMMALVNHPAGEKTFTGFLEEVKKTTLEALENQDYPFEELVSKIFSSREAGRNPLFDVFFILNDMILQAALPQEVETFDLKLIPYNYNSRRTRFDLGLFAVDTGENLAFMIEYAVRLFKKDTIERFAGYFKDIVYSVLEDKNVKLEDIKISHVLSASKEYFHEEEYLGFEF
ncbi:MAG: amino acid adenylation domain-containing protein [Candidatus Aminicenantes bacterium]|nr:MAG: amino acid adenylation domain-containing protein [Candidatus Aminicenantes bacterium]